MIQGMYSREFRCPEEQVKVEDLDGERFRASGCGQTVMYQCAGKSCIPDRRDEPREQTAVAGAPVPRPVHQASSGVARREKSQGKSLVSLDLKLDERATLKLRAAPAELGELVQLKVTRRANQMTLEDCELESLLNGRKTPMPKAKYDWNASLSASSLRVELSRDTIKQLGTAQHFALRACDFKWSLAADQLEELHRFVALYQEELAWRGDGKEEEPEAPASGWAAWNVAGVVQPAPGSGKPLEGPELFKLLAPSVYEVESQGASGSTFGSAVAISGNQLLTNCHVVQGSQRIIVKQKGNEWISKLSRSDAATDRCVLTCDAKLSPVRGVRAHADLAVGEAAFTLGAPNGLELSLANGIISGLREEAGRSYVQTTAPISPGSSGGGLFDARGNLIGITTLVLVGREHLNQALNFAIPAESFFRP